jgi:hypothetical protein
MEAKVTNAVGEETKGEGGRDVANRQFALPSICG